MSLLFFLFVAFIIYPRVLACFCLPVFFSSSVLLFLLYVLFSHHMPLSDAPRGYEIFDKKEENVLKIILKP